jgi:hypothetical protein
VGCSDEHAGQQTASLAWAFALEWVWNYSPRGLVGASQFMCLISRPLCCRVSVYTKAAMGRSQNVANSC